MLVHVCTHSQGEEKNGWQNVLLPWKKGIRPTYCIHQCSDCDHFPCRRTCPSSLRRARSLDLRDLNCSVLKTSSLVPKAHSTSPEGESCRVCFGYLCAGSRNVHLQETRYIVYHFIGVDPYLLCKGLYKSSASIELRQRFTQLWKLHEPLVYTHCHGVPFEHNVHIITHCLS